MPTLWQRSVQLAHIVTVLSLVGQVNSTKISKPFCHQRYIRQPRKGQRCVTDTEVYSNKTVLQHHCTWLCISDPNCLVINFKMKDNHCLFSQRPCLYVESNVDFVTTFMSMRKPCLKWGTSSDKDIYNAVLTTQIDGTSPVIAARCSRDNNKVPGKMVVDNGRYYYPWQGQEFDVVDASGCEILLLSPECNASWIPHDSIANDALPVGAVIGGHLNGVLLYVARKYAVHQTGHPARYSVGYYDNVDGLGHVSYGVSDKVYNQVEVLVVQG